MRKMLLRSLVAVGLGVVISSSAAFAQSTDGGAKPPPPPAKVANTSTADHSKFEELQKEFTSGPEVTKACLGCHTEADNQLKHSIHYTWEYEAKSGQKLGKAKVVNSFCGNVVSNEARCTSCHTGYGWTDMNTPPAQMSVAVDCLACHDRSGQYAKTATAAGHPPLAPVKKGMKTITGKPAWPVDLAKAAQSVALPERDNCGNCHFYGGGGDNVKHGDLSSVLYNPPVEIDVHMSPEGEDFNCSSCHVSDQHQWPGSRYDVAASDPKGTGKPGERRDVATCESCHDNDPHPTTLEGIKLNDHVNVVACPTCHIPEFARGGVATKTYWDWSTAGKLGDNGKPMAEAGYTQGDGKKLKTYMSQKGGMKWGEDLVPHYAWFDGQLGYTLTDETIDPTGIVDINKVNGERGDGVSRIWPFKRMEGRQAYDTGTNRLIYMHLFGPKSDTAFWKHFDWGKAIEGGMKAAGVEYSGNYDWLDTYMYWPLTHMVAPAKDAVECGECHSENGRMANLAGIYMPGAEPGSLINRIGQLMVLVALIGVIGHAVLRLVTRGKGGTNG